MSSIRCNLRADPQYPSILDPACCGWPRCRAICLISAQLPGFPPYNLQEFGQEFAAVPVGLTLVPYAKGHLPCDRRSNCAAYILFTPSHSFRLISNVHYSDSDEFPMNFECSYVPFSKIFLRAVYELRRTRVLRGWCTKKGRGREHPEGKGKEPRERALPRSHPSQHR